MTDVPPLRLKFVIVKAIGCDAHKVGLEETISAEQNAIRCGNGFGSPGISMKWLYKSEINSPQLSKQRHVVRSIRAIRLRQGRGSQGPMRLRGADALVVKPQPRRLATAIDC